MQRQVRLGVTRAKERSNFAGTRITGNNWWEINMERWIGSVLFMVLNSKLKICSSFSRYPCLRKINSMVLALQGKEVGR